MKLRLQKDTITREAVGDHVLAIKRFGFFKRAAGNRGLPRLPRMPLSVEKQTQIAWEKFAERARLGGQRRP